jgi:hypothetical protein
MDDRLAKSALEEAQFGAAPVAIEAGSKLATDSVCSACSHTSPTSPLPARGAHDKPLSCPLGGCQWLGPANAWGSGECSSFHVHRW